MKKFNICYVWKSRNHESMNISSYNVKAESRQKAEEIFLSKIKIELASYWVREVLNNE